MTPAPIVTLLLLAAEPAAASPPPAPVYERRGVKGPREAVPGCVRAALRVPTARIPPAR